MRKVKKYQAHDYVISKLVSKPEKIQERVQNIVPISADRYMYARQTTYNYYGYDIRDYGYEVEKRVYETRDTSVFNKMIKGIVESPLNDLEKYGLIAIVNLVKKSYFTSDKKAMNILYNRIPEIKPYVDEETYDAFMNVAKSIRVSRPATQEEKDKMNEIRAKIRKKKVQEKLKKKELERQKKKNRKEVRIIIKKKMRKIE